MSELQAQCQVKDISLVTARRTNQFLNKKYDPTQCLKFSNLIVRAVVQVKYDKSLLANIIVMIPYRTNVIRQR